MEDPRRLEELIKSITFLLNNASEIVQEMRRPSKWMTDSDHNLFVAVVKRMLKPMKKGGKKKTNGNWERSRVKDAKDIKVLSLFSVHEYIYSIYI